MTKETPNPDEIDPPAAPLTADDLKTVLKADPGAQGPNETDMVKKVASGQALSAAERGHIETRVAQAESAQTAIEIMEVAGDRQPRGKPNRIRKPGTKAAGRDFAVRERRLLIVSKRMKWPPMTIKKIAEELGVTQKTISQDIAAMRAEHADIFSGKHSADLTMQSLDAYDMLARQAAALSETYTNPTAKSRMMLVAGRMLAWKTELMVETGAIKAAPKTVKNEHSGPGGLPLAVGAPYIPPAPEAGIREKARALIAQRQAVRPAAPAGTVPFPTAATG